MTEGSYEITITATIIIILLVLLVLMLLLLLLAVVSVYSQQLLEMHFNDSSTIIINFKIDKLIIILSFSITEML